MYTVCLPTDCDPNKLRSLRLTIRTLKAQSMPPGEIIISTNAIDSINFVDEILETFPDLEIVDSSGKILNASYARNNAAQNSKFEHILFIDDDTLIGNVHFMKLIMSNVDAFDFACGARRLWAPSNWEQTILELDPIAYTVTVLNKLSIEPFNISRRSNKQRLSNYSFIGNFGIISRKAFEKSGGFDEDFNGWGYEDADLMQELLHQDNRFFLLKSLGVYCIHLSHYTDKAKVQENIRLYNDKCIKRGRRFEINHLFGLFENDGYHLVSSLT